MKRAVLALSVLCVTGSLVSASPERPVSITERAQGAQTIVVGKIIEVTPAFETNEFGDRLIVSHAFLQVEETLKGSAAQVIPLDVEGGTVGGLTLRVSDMEPIAVGERAVFFITRSKAGANVPHLRHNGIVKLDATNHVQGTNLQLDAVKTQVRQGLLAK